MSHLEIIKLNSAVTKISCSKSAAPFFSFLCRVSARMFLCLPLLIFAAFFYFPQLTSGTRITLFVVLGTQVLLYLFSTRLNSEHVYLIKEFGINIEKHSLGESIQKTFIPRDKLREVIINEALTTCDVKVYLALLIHDASEMQLLFESFDLDTKRLVQVYEAIKGHILK